MWIPGQVNLLEEANLSSFHHQISQAAAHKRENPEVKLTASEVYKELRLRGYDYGRSFQGILESSQAGKIHLGLLSVLPSITFVPIVFWCPPGDEGRLQWTGNWVTFLDTMLQMLVVGLPGRSLRLPTRIRSLCLDPALHLQKVCRSADGSEGA